MACERNKKVLYYALNLHNDTDIVDGKHTGEFVQQYSEPVKIYANINQGIGDYVLNQNGIVEKYTYKVIIEGDTPIEKDSILWVGIPTSEKFNAIVRAKHKSLTYSTLYIELI